ncbi:unnamed protein product [Nippostrongylus brasiliensis]|uniref:EF-hand_like domain-containing protein n=1 Tax=Nippostrongylus brasiliensis TaxID=27835 RepID=A0A158R1P5_NIPBR|nr:unnamed protein product [Nippostrongylus brasiliensis]
MKKEKSSISSVDEESERRAHSLKRMSRSGIVTLYKRFLSLATHRDKATNEYFLTETDFQSIAELQQNPLGQRIIDAFFADAE